jgi:hypothetical protein
MPKNASISRESKSGKFVSEPLGKSKATKFAAVEGLALTKSSERTVSRLEGRGLKGEAFRDAVVGAFRKK